LQLSLLQKLQPMVNPKDGASLLQGPAKKDLPPVPARTSALQLCSSSPSLQAMSSLTTQPIQQVLHKPLAASTASHSPAMPQDHLITSNIHEAVINEFLSTPLEQTGREEQGQFSSSDTVNELLKGFAAPSPQEATHMLTKETEEVLPSFSHALKQQQFSLSQGIEEKINTFFIILQSCLYINRDFAYTRK